MIVKREQRTGQADIAPRYVASPLIGEKPLLV